MYIGTAEENNKEFLSSEIKEVARIHENLDNSSIILARTYMTALSDKQQLEKVAQKQS